MSAKFPGPESRKLGLLCSVEDNDLKQKQWAKEDYEIMLSILEENGIHGCISDASVWFALALKLAQEIPRYTQPKKKGRKPKWDDLCKGILVVEMERVINGLDGKKSIDSAAYKLSIKEPWKSFIDEKDDGY